MAQSLPPVSREQAFLETYFQCLSQFAYEKAKELCEKEKEAQKANYGTTWGSLLNCLIILASSEKTYASLLFLGQKWFYRKDNLRSSYGLLLGELKKIEENRNKAAAQDVEMPVLEELLVHLCGQLGHFLTARSKTMDFYEQMSTMGNNRNVNYEDLVIVITEIIQAHQRNFHHPMLSPLKTSFSLECDIGSHLLQAQLQMAHWRFLPALLHLNDASSKLTSWSLMMPTKETKKLSFASSKNSTHLALYQWLVKFKGMMVSKFSLYFHEVLSKQAPAGDMKTVLARTTVDFCSKIMTFQKKSDATNVSLVFDATGIQDVHKAAGYHHPHKFTEPPKGLDSYPAIFSCPFERPDRHWPSVISIMNDKTPELNTYDKIIYFCDERFQNTFFMSRVEPRVTFVVIFETKKSEKDSYVNNFIMDICAQLRCIKLFASLKGGSKG